MKFPMVLFAVIFTMVVVDGPIRDVFAVWKEFIADRGRDEPLPVTFRGLLFFSAGAVMSLGVATLLWVQVLEEFR